MIVIYAAMNRIYSSRDIETACRRDINFMYLLEGKPAPDHATIARFFSLHFSQCSKKTLGEVTGLLLGLGEISGRHVFIDGTKIESTANRYTFVWKKAVTKNQARLCEKIASFVEECEKLYGKRLVYNGTKFGIRMLKKIRKKLYRIKTEEEVEFVHGCGKRKSQIQRSIETVNGFLEKLKEYNHKIYLCGNRNSFSKTDHDATFMRMKEDHMMNGQLKPAYNLQHGIDAVIKYAEFFQKKQWDEITGFAVLVDLAVTVFLAEEIKKLFPVNLVVMMLLIFAGYSFVRGVIHMNKCSC